MKPPNWSGQFPGATATSNGFFHISQWDIPQKHGINMGYVVNSPQQWLIYMGNALLGYVKTIYYTWWNIPISSVLVPLFIFCAIRGCTVFRGVQDNGLGMKKGKITMMIPCQSQQLAWVINNYKTSIRFILHEYSINIFHQYSINMQSYIYIHINYFSDIPSRVHLPYILLYNYSIDIPFAAWRVLLSPEARLRMLWREMDSARLGGRLPSVNGLV